MLQTQPISDARILSTNQLICEGNHVKEKQEDKPRPKTSQQPKAMEIADPEDVKKAIARAKRILFLTMPTSPTIH